MEVYSSPFWFLTLFLCVSPLPPISGTGIQKKCFFSCGPAENGRVEQVCQAAQIPRLGNRDKKLPGPQGW